MAEYIDRQAVREILYNHYSRDVYTHEGIVHKVTAEIDVDELNSIPAADVRENVKGEWIERKDMAVECSACGQIAPYEANSWGDVIVALKYDFCPWCGAEMRTTCDGDSCPL